MIDTGVEPFLWALVIVFWGFGDTMTTYVAVKHYDGVEKNPLPRRAFDAFGVWSMFPLKLFGLAVIYLSWRALGDEPTLRIAALSVVSVLGVAVTVWNAYQILRAVTATDRDSSALLRLLYEPHDVEADEVDAHVDEKSDRERDQSPRGRLYGCETDDESDTDYEDDDG